MVAMDTRIKREAARIKAELTGVQHRALERLREYIADDVYNMLSRYRATGGEKEQAAEWLHMRTYDQTYRDDYSPESQAYRTRTRIEALLALADGDRELLLKEYGAALNRRFPTSGSYVWSPKFISVTMKSGKKRISMRYHWKKRQPTNDTATTV